MTVMSFKTRIYPTKNQVEYFHKAFGIRRFVWNWALEEYFKSLDEGNFKGAFDLQKQLNNTLVKQEEYSWLNEINSMVRQESLKDLSLGLKKYHDKQKEARKTTKTIDSEKFKPKFKSKKKDINSFRYNNKGNPVTPNGKKHFYLTTVKSKKNRLNIKCAESLLFLKSDDIRFTNITISEKAGYYFLIVTYEKTNHKRKRNNNDIVGIDMGVKTPLTCTDSNGKSFKFELPKNLRKQEKKTERLDRIMSRKTYGSKRFEKAKRRLQRSYLREVNIRKDFREKISNFLCKNYKVIKLEPYTFKSVSNLKNVQRALSRVSGYEFVERLKDKCKTFNNDLIFIPPFTPTTQTCSKCGYRHIKNDKLTLSDRTFMCKECGYIEDRDVNASINILNFVI